MERIQSVSYVHVLYPILNHLMDLFIVSYLPTIPLQCRLTRFSDRPYNSYTQRLICLSGASSSGLFMPSNIPSIMPKTNVICDLYGLEQELQLCLQVFHDCTGCSDPVAIHRILRLLWPYLHPTINRRGDFLQSLGKK